MNVFDELRFSGLIVGYLLTLGERRFRAFMFLELKEIPAIIVKTSPDTRLMDQLAENIQREALSLLDEAAAIRVAYDKIGNVEKVADFVGKSTSWVSKRLAMTFDNFGLAAKNMLIEGTCFDVEMLNLLSQLEKVKQEYARVLPAKITAGTIKRDELRELLRMEKNAKKTPANVTAANVTEPKTNQEQPEHQPSYTNNLLSLAMATTTTTTPDDAEKPRDAQKKDKRPTTENAASTQLEDEIIKLKQRFVEIAKLIENVNLCPVEILKECKDLKCYSGSAD